MPPLQQLDKRAVFVAFLIALGAIAIQPKLLEFSSKWAYGSWPARPQTGAHIQTQLISATSSQHRRAQSTAAAQDQWGREAVASAFKRYGNMAATESTKMRMAFGRLDAESAAVGEAIGYPGKLDRMDEAEAVNAAVCKAVGDMAVKENKMDAEAVGANKQGSLFRVREAMWHYVRDWTEEGRVERTVIFKPVLDLLQSLDKPEERGEKTVLIPGSGLGRLAWDISELGTSSAMKGGHTLMTRIQRNCLRILSIHEHGPPLHPQPTHNHPPSRTYYSTMGAPLLAPIQGRYRIPADRLS